jgi:site-specific DNA-cytosine methylase
MGGSETMIVEKRLQFAEAYQHHGYRMSETANTLTAGQNSSVRGDTSFVIENNIVRFDDFTINKDTDGRWAHICKDCVDKYGISEALLDDGCATGCTCGVQGCENEADYYIDIPEDIKGPAEDESVWAVALDALKGIGRRIVYRIRRQTPLECERLDGFPDEWTKYDTKGNKISDTARYTALGNSIAIPCAERVFQGIAAVEMEVAGNDG